MLTLHGFPFSNYHNIVKHALLQKDVPFNEHIVYPNSEEMAVFNPSGKVPAITTEQGTNIAESSVLCDYLEDAYPQNPLYPADPDARAQVRFIMKVAELYIELPARRLLPAVMGNATFDDSTLGEVRSTLERGVKSLTALVSFSPYLTGATLTLADIYLRYALAIPKLIGPSQLDWDIVAAIPGLSDWDAMMADSEISKRIDADQRDNTAEFMAHIAANAS